MAIRKPQTNTRGQLVMSRALDRDLDLDLDLDSTSFDNISLTQMIDLQTQPIYRSNTLPWMSQKSQEYSQYALAAKVKQPFVPAAPNSVRGKSYDTYSRQAQFGSGSRPCFTHEDKEPKFYINCSTRKAQQNKHEQGRQNSFHNSSAFFENASNYAEFGLSHQSYDDIPAAKGEQTLLHKCATRAETHDLEYGLQRNNPFIQGKEQISSSRKHSSASQNFTEHQGNPRVGGVELRSVDEIPRQFQGIFKFPYFNILQSLLLDEILYTDKSVVASAPTGSGKTVIFELALIRLLTKLESPELKRKIIYMAPMKALCSERYIDWNNKFGNLGINCLEITGDSELDDFAELFNANLICTTPEKWDSVSRRWKDNKKLFQQIQLFLIDEIHILNDPHRGATVEAVVSRMKTLETAQELDSTTHIRFVAVSATMPNYNDIAEWLGTPSKPASAFNLSEEFRPVKLDRIVLGYPFKEGTSDFRFDMNLSYRLKSIIETHSHGKPSLVFCSSRKSVVQSAEALAGDLRTNNLLSRFSAETLHAAAKSVHEHKLSELLHRGIGIHHAGLDIQDRHTVEDLFKASQLPVLISTSTLAMGVNLPAHLVVIKSTHFYNMGMVQEYSNMQVLQMIGRAGRPQFDTSATAVIMTKTKLKAKYSTLVNGTQLIESSLHKNLIEHLNAEIVLQTIRDMSLVVEWIRHTFLYVRALKNPCYYGLSSNLSTQEVEKKLQDLCLQNVTHLTKENLVFVNDEVGSIWPTDNGKLMARYCIAFETMKHFSCIDQSQENIAEMIKTIAHCAEFDDIQLRINEKRILNSLNRDKNKETIRFALPGKIKTKQMKVNCLIQAQLSCLPVQDFSLSQDMAKIFRVGQRVAKCLMEFMYHGNSYSVLLHAILIYKAFKAKLWFDSRYVARQLDGIGPTLSLALANAGLSSFHKLDEAHPRDIEVIVNRHPPFGNQVKEALAKLPRYELAVEQMKCYKPHKCALVLTVDLLNRSAFETVPSSQITHQSILIVGDADNKIVFKWRVFDAAIFRDGMLTRTVEVNRASEGSKLSISLLSQDTVGLDIQTEYEPVYQEGWFPPCQRPLTSKDQTPASKLKAAMDKSKAEPQLKGSCNHKCVNKSACGHKCCKSNDLGKRPATEMETSDRPAANSKSQKVEKPSYRESKDMKDILSIFGGQQSGLRLKMNKFDQQLTHHGSVQKETNKCSNQANVHVSSGQNSNDFIYAECDEFENDDLSDVIILEGDLLENDTGFEEFSPVDVVSRQAETERKGNNISNTSLNARDRYPDKPSSKYHSTGKQHCQNLECENTFAEKQKNPPRNMYAQKYGIQNIRGNKMTPAENKKIIDSAEKQKQNGSFIIVGKDKNLRQGIAGKDIWEQEDVIWKGEEVHIEVAPTSANKREYQADTTLDVAANGWADLDVFHQSRQSLFRDGRPIHLRDDEWAGNDKDFEDELPSLTTTPEPRPSLPVRPQQQQQQQQQLQQRQQFTKMSVNDSDCPWTTTTSSDEELCFLVDGATCPSAETSYSPLDHRTNKELSGYDQRDLMSINPHSLSPTRKPLNDPSKPANRWSASGNQSQNLGFGGLDQRSKACQQIQRSLATGDGSGIRGPWPHSDGSEMRAPSDDFQEQTASRTVCRRSSIAQEHFIDAPSPPTVISLTDSELSHGLALSVGSRHLNEGIYLQNVLHGDATDKMSVDSLSQQANSTSLSKENSSPTSNKTVSRQKAQNYNGFKDTFCRGFSFHSKAAARESKSSVESEQESSCHDGNGNMRNKSPGRTQQSSHRYGHVLAWNKASRTGGRSGQQSSTEQRPGESKPQSTGFSFFNHVERLPSDEASNISTSLFDGIF